MLVFAIRKEINTPPPWSHLSKSESRFEFLTSCSLCLLYSVSLSSESESVLAWRLSCESSIVSLRACPCVCLSVIRAVCLFWVCVWLLWNCMFDWPYQIYFLCIFWKAKTTSFEEGIGYFTEIFNRNIKGLSLAPTVPHYLWQQTIFFINQ